MLLTFNPRKWLCRPPSVLYREAKPPSEGNTKPFDLAIYLGRYSVLSAPQLLTQTIRTTKQMKIKQHLIDEAVRLTGIRKKDCAVIVDSILELIALGMISGESIAIRGLGEFSFYLRPAYIGHSPMTDAPLHFKATRIPKFKPSKMLRQRAAEAFRKETGE